MSRKIGASVVAALEERTAGACATSSAALRMMGRTIPT